MSKRSTNGRVFDQGLLIKIQKSINADIKRNNSTKEEFATEIGMTKGTMENKWTFSCKTNDFTVHELIQIMELTGDMTPLEYICHMFDMSVTSNNISSNITAEELSKLADESAIEGNEAFATVKKAAADGKITLEEKENIKKELIESIEAKQRELAAVEKIVPFEDEE